MDLLYLEPQSNNNKTLSVLLNFNVKFRSFRLNWGVAGG